MKNGIRFGDYFDVRVKVRVRRLVGMVRVRGWVKHYAYDNPYKDGRTRMYVCVCVCVVI